MKVIFLVVAAISAAVLGVIADWLLKSRLPLKPKSIHFAIGITVCLVLAFIATLPEIFVEPKSTPVVAGFPTLPPLPQQVTPLGPTPTPNAYAVAIDAFVEPNTSVLAYQVVNLDGLGPDEIVIRWEYDQPTETLTLGGVDVVAWTGETWKNVLRLKELEYNCGVYWGEFGIVNLFHDQTRQLVTWLQCGTGSFLSLEIYKYQGLGLFDRIYKTPDPLTGQPENRWMESVPLIFNETLYIVHASELYKYSWVAGDLIGEKAELDLGASGVTVDYWMGDDGKPHASPENITLSVGQYLYLRSANDSTLPQDPRIQVCCDGSLEFDRNNHLLRAVKPGVSVINLWGWADQPLVTVTIVE